MRVTFIHPDLGIGGAERLIVDAAVGLKSKDHEVTMVTNHYDKTHCFKETEELNVKKVAFFPRTLCGKMWAMCAYIRMCLAALYVCLFIESDVIIVDQVSACLLVLRLFSKAKLVFYCHYPDLLLTQRDTTLKYYYRYVLDFLEEYSTGKADVVCVNSNFTASVFRETFKSLENTKLQVVYPSLNTSFFDNVEVEKVSCIPPKAKYIFTSLNRFEVKKNVKLALEAFAALQSILSSEVFEKCFLIIAGGYDTNNYENIEYYRQLTKYSQDLNIDSRQITFLKSPSDKVKINILRESTAVLYTPDKEHFGIVPVEAMYLGTPVIAVNSGGPKESVDNNKTGFLVEQDADQFARCMKTLIEEESLLDSMRKNGPEKVQKVFSFSSFTNSLDEIVNM